MQRLRRSTQPFHSLHSFRFSWVKRPHVHGFAVARYVYASAINDDICTVHMQASLPLLLLLTILTTGLELFVIVWCHQFESIARIDRLQLSRRVIVARSFVFLELNLRRELYFD